LQNKGEESKQFIEIQRDEENVEITRQNVRKESKE
jgi:hypothetical protein